MHCSLENRKTGRVEEEVTVLTPDSSRDSTNKRTSEQTGPTAGPGSVREAVKVTRVRGEARRVPPHNSRLLSQRD